jgi:ankyrin repeat protein
MTPKRITVALAALLFLPLGLAAAQDAKQQLNEQLYEAARKGDAAQVKALLDKGADVNAKFRYGATALFKAAERGNTDVVKLLIERGADVKVQDTFYKATAMTWALDKGHVEVVRALLEKGGGEVDAVLMAGARGGNAALVQVALDKGGAKPETLTAALTAASKDGKAEIVEALKKAGAQPPPEVDAATLQTYAGKYKNEQGFEVVVAAKDGKLSIAPGGQPPMELNPVDKTTFRPIAFDATISFNVEAGKTTGFNFKQGTNSQLFKRVE